MFKILDRYILGAFLVNYLIAIGVLVGLYIILDLFVNLDEFSKVPGETTAQIAAKVVDYYGHNLFVYFAQLAGVITLMAACFTLGRLHRTNELTAILSSGTSLYRVAAPILLAGLSMNALWFIDQEFVIPRFAAKLARKHGDIEGRNTYAIWFMRDPSRNNALISASMFSPRAREMRQVIIIERNEEDELIGVIRADQARWDEETKRWLLKNGFHVRPGALPGEGGGPTGRQQVMEYVSSITPREMALQQSSQWTNFLSLPDLNRLQAQAGDQGAAEFIKVKHTRLTTVIVNMTLLCLGIPFFLNRERPSIIVLGGKALLMCGLCYVFTFMCQSIDLTPLGVSPALAPWLPVLVFVPIAVVLVDGIKT